MASHMVDHVTRTIRDNYDRLAREYTVHLFDELQHKPLDRELLTHFARQTKGRGTVCDVGCGPGHITRFLHDLHVSVLGLDLSSGMVAEARGLSPELEFRQGDILALGARTSSRAKVALGSNACPGTRRQCAASPAAADPVTRDTGCSPAETAARRERSAADRSSPAASPRASGGASTARGRSCRGALVSRLEGV